MCCLVGSDLLAALWHRVQTDSDLYMMSRSPFPTGPQIRCCHQRELCCFAERRRTARNSDGRGKVRRAQVLDVCSKFRTSKGGGRAAAMSLPLCLKPYVTRFLAIPNTIILSASIGDSVFVPAGMVHAVLTIWPVDFIPTNRISILAGSMTTAECCLRDCETQVLQPRDPQGTQVLVHIRR